MRHDETLRAKDQVIQAQAQTIAAQAELIQALKEKIRDLEMYGAGDFSLDEDGDDPDDPAAPGTDLDAVAEEGLRYQILHFDDWRSRLERHTRN